MTTKPGSTPAPRTPPPDDGGTDDPLARSAGLLTGMLALLLALNTLLTLAVLTLFVGYRGDATFPENSVATGAWAVGRGEPVYADWREWPHRFAPYGPLLYYPAGWLASAIEGGATLGLSHYMVGRAESLLAIMGMAVAAALLARRAGARRGPAWIVAMGWLALWGPLMTYLVSYRPDAPMAAAALFAVWVSLGDLSRRRACMLAIALLWVSVGYKHGAWAAPLAVLAAAWRQLGARPALAWGALYAGGVAAATAAMQWATEGRFLLNIASALTSGFEIPSAFGGSGAGTGSSLRLEPDLLMRMVVAVGLAAWLLAAGRTESVTSGDADRPRALTHAWRARLLAGYFLLAFGVAVVQMFKIGSDINYFAESYALAGAVGAVGWSRLTAPGAGWRRSAASHAWRIAATAGLAAMLLWPLAGNLSGAAPTLKALYERARPEARINPFSRRPAPILLFESAFLHPDPRAHAIPDPFIYVLMVESGRVSPRPLIERLESGEFAELGFGPQSAEMLLGGRGTPDIRAAIERHYALAETWPPGAEWAPFHLWRRGGE